MDTGIDWAEVLTIDREEAYRAYAEAIGATARELTETERATALLNHVMEKCDPSLTES